jgi:hypothetical protein
VKIGLHQSDIDFSVFKGQKVEEVFPMDKN